MNPLLLRLKLLAVFTVEPVGVINISGIEAIWVVVEPHGSYISREADSGVESVNRYRVGWDPL